MWMLEIDKYYFFKKKARIEYKGSRLKWFIVLNKIILVVSVHTVKRAFRKKVSNMRVYNIVGSCKMS